MRGARVFLFRFFSLVALALVISAAPAMAAPKAKTLYSFCPDGYPNCPDGATPMASLVRDATGNIFGTTENGGSGAGVGTVFELTADGKLNTLHSFCDSPCADGMSPYNPLIADVNGNLYGMVTQGGTTGLGVVFKLTPKHKKYVFSVLHTFCEEDGCPDGELPIGGLTYQGAQSGALYDGVSPLYGATAGDDTVTFGSVFELIPKKRTAEVKTLAALCPSGTGCPEGYDPGAGVVLDASGNIYGTTAIGGANGNGGAVFELVRQSKGYQTVVLYAFCALSNCADGSRPIAPLVIDGSGNLIGTTLTGGSNTSNGTIFSVKPNGANSKETVLHAFCATDCSDGGQPYGGLVLGADGTLYGTTAASSNGGGSVFSIKGSKFHVLVNFHSNSEDPKTPEAGLILDASGNLYGTSVNGGTYGAGAVFEVTP
jgi:uncharacterized repeat protein (TIGR03803 family)